MKNKSAKTKSRSERRKVNSSVKISEILVVKNNGGTGPRSEAQAALEEKLAMASDLRRDVSKRWRVGV